MGITIFLILFVLLLVIGSPIYVAMIVSSIAYIFMNPSIDFVIIIQKLSSSVNSFPLLAVPLFIFAGNLMNLGGVTKRIFQFAEKLVGHYRGGLGHVNIVSSIIFSGMSGSALADVGGLGQIELAAMKQAKYDDDFSLGVTAASGTIGPIIPPSIPFVLFGAFTSVSVGSLFMGGFLPGLLMGLCLMVMVVIIAKKRNYPRSKRATFKELWYALRKGFFALLTPVIIIGGIWSGFFTPTEAAMVACMYTLIISIIIYKDIRIKDIPQMMAVTFKTITPSLAILIGATLFGWILNYEKVDVVLLNLLTSITTNKYIILLIFNVILFLLGMLMDGTAAMLIVIPFMLPIASTMGINPIHLGVVIVLNLMIGLLTPPVGFSLNLLSTMTGYKLDQVAKMVWPWMIPLIIALMLVTYIPDIVLFIPRLVGLTS